ncbi:unnamed protein product [Pleuronectes platessa]|uniref:Uncharacterized protein n=1 Tax=Pleuronectes platessa TaxID=8262 RepID=A0A9N7URZ0_PLEPL|nr:unnamed protein product [Pleuronectes platessa]
MSKVAKVNVDRQRRNASRFLPAPRLNEPTFNRTLLVNNFAARASQERLSAERPSTGTMQPETGGGVLEHVPRDYRKPHSEPPGYSRGPTRHRATVCPLPLPPTPAGKPGTDCYEANKRAADREPAARRHHLARAEEGALACDLPRPQALLLGEISAASRMGCHMQYCLSRCHEASSPRTSPNEPELRAVALTYPDRRLCFLRLSTRSPAVPLLLSPLLFPQCYPVILLTCFSSALKNSRSHQHPLVLPFCFSSALKNSRSHQHPLALPSCFSAALKNSRSHQHPVYLPCPTLNKRY